MDQRKIELLMRIIDSYILSGEPVGSVSLLERYRLPYSSATIRNEMADLEEEGHLFQPHTSAGRIPTEQGYRLYVQHLKPVRMPSKSEHQFWRLWTRDEESADEQFKALSKAISELSGEIGFAAFDGHHTYVAGLSTICDKPEFSDRKIASTLTDIVEKIDDIIESIFPHVGTEPEIWIGKRNKLAPHCSAILLKCTYQGSEGIIGIVGPMRMRYGRNKAILSMIKDVLHDS